MSSLLDRGIFFFNAGRYFEAHEAWEDLWRECPPERRILYQALVQAAVGLHHLSRNNLIGTRAQLSKSVAKLDLQPAVVEGIDVGSLRQDLRELLVQLEVGGTTDVRNVRLKSSRVVVESEGTP
jgi:uncharacterized protein